MSDTVKAAFAAGEVVSGTVGIEHGFVRKLRSTFCNALCQLSTEGARAIFLNYTPDPGMMVVEFDQPSEVEHVFRDEVPPSCALVVFRNYDWTTPKVIFGADVLDG